MTGSQLLDQLPGLLRRDRRALDAVALLSGVDPKLLAVAAKQIERGRFVLVGTMALKVRGYPVTAQDVDFLCAWAPGGMGDGTGSGGSSTIEVAGREVDYIHANESRARFLTRWPDVILDVPVASVEHVLGLKRFAGRPKDLEFLEWFETEHAPCTRP